ncbi:hypothetical protein DEM26_17425 [Thioclava sp. NG1]|uniref:hypothetical protein n=1 Tax=Thioclava sp. NG1 TaxID=2182426 RepID=UPI000D616114|nr:hypothetical protein [Thioclava sp. NG1]PWE48581.1 hypothetical protein DEM26_17425 [Thioclava sp. NG1]
MIWAGRLNAIIALIAIFGGIVCIAGALINSDGGTAAMALSFFGVFILFGALFAKIGFVLADTIYRAAKGKPLIYDQKVTFDRARGANISE